MKGATLFAFFGRAPGSRPAENNATSKPDNEQTGTKQLGSENDENLSSPARKAPDAVDPQEAQATEPSTNSRGSPSMIPMDVDSDPTQHPLEHHSEKQGEVSVCEADRFGEPSTVNSLSTEVETVHTAAAGPEDGGLTGGDVQVLAESKMEDELGSKDERDVCGDENSSVKTKKPIKPEELPVAKRQKSEALASDPTTVAEKLQQIDQELEELKRYLLQEEEVQIEHPIGCGKVDLKRMVASIVEESALPLSELVSHTYEVTLRLYKENSCDVEKLSTTAVKNCVLLVAERKNYAVGNPESEDIDMLEDKSEENYWRWQVRDDKLLPEVSRETFVERRKRWSKVQQRMRALASARSSLAALDLSASVSDPSARSALAQLGKVDGLHRINELILENRAKLETKRAAQRERRKSKEDEKSIKRDEAKAQKQQEKEALRKAKEAEKEAKELHAKKEREEKQRLKEEKEAQKEAEKEAARQQKEAERKAKEDEKKAKEEEKEAARLAKEQQRLEKEAEVERAENKRKAELEKRKSLMANFFVKKATPSKDAESSTAGAKDERTKDALFLAPAQAPASAASPHSVAEDMDRTLATLASCSAAQPTTSALLTCWKAKNRSTATKAPGERARWGYRRVAKQRRSSAETAGAEPEMMEMEAVGEGGEVEGAAAVPAAPRPRKLLQFHEEHRPPFWGTWPSTRPSKHSKYVRARRPLKEDPALDYDFDSADEWEEEAVGESLSQSEGEGEGEDEERAEEKAPAEEDEEAADGFMVPDGYLSEDEGAGPQEEEGAEEGRAEAGDGAPRSLPAADEAKAARLRKHLDAHCEAARRSGRLLVVSSLPAPPISGEGGAGCHVSGDPALLKAFPVVVLEGELVIAPPTPPQTLHTDSAGAAGSNDQGGAKPRAKAPAGFPEALQEALVRHLLAHPKLKVNKASELFVLQHVAAHPSLTKLQVKRRVLLVAEHTAGRWQITAEALEAAGIADADALRPAAPAPGSKERKGAAGGELKRRLSAGAKTSPSKKAQTAPASTLHKFGFFSATPTAPPSAPAPAPTASSPPDPASSIPAPAPQAMETDEEAPAEVSEAPPAEPTATLQPSTDAPAPLPSTSSASPPTAKTTAEAKAAQQAEADRVEQSSGQCGGGAALAPASAPAPAMPASSWAHEMVGCIRSTEHPFWGQLCARLEEARASGCSAMPEAGAGAALPGPADVAEALEVLSAVHLPGLVSAGAVPSSMAAALLGAVAEGSQAAAPLRARCLLSLSNLTHSLQHAYKEGKCQVAAPGAAAAIRLEDILKAVMTGGEEGLKDALQAPAEGCEGTPAAREVCKRAAELLLHLCSTGEGGGAAGALEWAEDLRLALTTPSWVSRLRALVGGAGAGVAARLGASLLHRVLQDDVPLEAMFAHRRGDWLALWDAVLGALQGAPHPGLRKYAVLCAAALARAPHHAAAALQDPARRAALLHALLATLHHYPPEGAPASPPASGTTRQQTLQAALACLRHVTAHPPSLLHDHIPSIAAAVTQLCNLDTGAVKADACAVVHRLRPSPV